MRVKRTIHESFLGYFLIAPAILFLSLFIAYPVFMSLILSLYKWVGAGSMTFIGLHNFSRLFRDSVFFIALKNSAIFTIVTTIFTVSLGFCWAVIIDLEVRFWRFYRTAFYLPITLNFVVVAMLWQKILEPGSILSTLLRYLGLGSFDRAWLGDPRTVIFAICWIGIWQYNGLWMLFFLAAMKNIDSSIYEAAIIDGASTLRRVFSITAPLCRHVFFVSTMLALIWGFRVFAQVWSTTQGGPLNASEVLTTYLYRSAFFERRVGYASALAIFLLLIAVLLGLVYLRILRSQQEDYII